MSRTLLLALLVVSLPGCSDLTGAADRKPVALRLDPDTVLATKGETVVVGVKVLDEHGEPFQDIPAWAVPIWSPQDGSKVAVDGGALRLLDAGGSWVHVEVGGLFARVVVRANPATLDLHVGAAYLTQSVQRLDGSVPLVEGRDALLRVFLTGDQPSFFRPHVRAILASRDGSVRTLDLLPESDSLPVEIDEGSLVTSWNALIPGSLVQPGLSFVIEADPEGRVPRAAGSATRFPATGVVTPIIRTVPPLTLHLIPVQQVKVGTTGQVSAANLESFIVGLRDMWPVAELDVDIRAPYLTTTSLSTDIGWVQLLGEIDALRVADGGAGHYYAVATAPSTRGIIGIGYVGWPVAVGVDDPEFASETLAHELGHNFGLQHAPCGGAGFPDQGFPYEGARTGAFGYDVTAREVKNPESTRDIMSYCSPKWVSDYNYENVLALRAASAGLQQATAADGLLIWGRFGPQGPVLEPAFRLWLAPTAPAAAGAVYLVEGFDASGVRLFSRRFEAHPVDHLPGISTFALALPTRLAHPDRLARLRVSGPEGEAWQERRGTPRMALLRDTATGEILSFQRVIQPGLRPGPGTELLYSDGVRTTRIPSAPRPSPPPR